MVALYVVDTSSRGVPDANSKSSICSLFTLGREIENRIGNDFLWRNWNKIDNVQSERWLVRSIYFGLPSFSRGENFRSIA